MEPPHVNHNPQHDKYQFCYFKDDPGSLTITKHPSIIYDSLYKQGNYVWIIKDVNQLKYKPEYIQQQATVKIDFVKTFQDFKSQFQHKQNIVIICHIHLLKDVQTDDLKQMFYDCKIKCVIFYGVQKLNHKRIKYEHINSSYVDSEQRAIQQIEENKKYYKSGDFVNFISLQKSIWDSNILVKTMFAMIKQKTNIQQIMGKFSQLASLCFDEYKPDIQQLMNQYSKNGRLTDNKAVFWYTKQTFLYRFINRILRISKDPNCLFIIQPYFHDLFFNIFRLYFEQKEKSVYQVGQKTISYKQFTCFRGGQISDNEIKFFKQNVGSYIQNLGFLSTSRYQGSCKNFVKNAQFEIVVENKQRNILLDYGYADLNEYSLQSEAEILFNPLNSFKIIDFHQNGGIYKITLKYGEMARVVASENKNLTEKQQSLKWLGDHQIRESGQCGNMGKVLIQLTSNMQSSQQYCEKFFEIANSSQNQDDILDGHRMKGTFAKNKGDYKTMEIQFTKCLKIIEKKIKLGIDDKKYKEEQAGILNNLGFSFQLMGQYEKAVEYYRRCEKKLRQTQGEYHPIYAGILNNLGFCFKLMDQYEKAAEYYQRCEKILRQTQGEYHPIYSNTLNNLGSFLNQIGQYEKGVEYFQRCEKIRRQILGEYHPDYARTLNNLGSSFKLMGQYGKAVEYYQRCEKIQKQILGENHPEYATTLNNLGVSFKEMGQYEKAVEYYQRCEKIQRQILEENHPDYARTLNNLGSSFKLMGQYEKAVNYFQKSQKIFRLKLGQNHHNYVVVLDNLNSLSSQKFLLLKIQKSNKSQMMGVSLMFQSQIKKCLTCKQYKDAMSSIISMLNICKNISNVYRSILIEKVNLYLQILLSQVQKQVRNSYDLAVKHKGKGLQREAKEVYSDILKKFSFFWKYRPEIMKMIESDLQNLQQKKKEERQLINFVPNYEISQYNDSKNKMEEKDYGEISLHYYLDICKDSISQTSKFASKFFEFQLYNEVISYIEDVDIGSAVTAMQTITDLQKDCEQLQAPKNLLFKEAIDELNSLFMIMLDIYAPEKPNFSERFKQGRKKLKKSIKRILDGQKQQRKPRVKEGNFFKNEEEIMIKVEKSQQNDSKEKMEEKDDAEINLHYYLDICKESVSQISKFASNLFEFQLYNEVISYIEDVKMESAVSEMQIIIAIQLYNEQLKAPENLPLKKAIDGLDRLFMIMLDIYDLEKPNFSERFEQRHNKLKELLMKLKLDKPNP